MTYTDAIAEEIYLELKKAPLTVGELSQTLNLAENDILPIIKDMPDKYPICQENDKYYVPKESIKAWIGAFITIYLVLDIFWELI